MAALAHKHTAPNKGSLVGWGSFLGFSGILFAGEGLILAMDTVGESHPVPADPVPLAQAVIGQAPLQAAITVLGLLGVLGSLVLFFKARPVFGSTTDFLLGVVGLLVTALVGVVALADSKVPGLGTLLFGAVAAGAGSWSLARTVKPQSATQAPPATTALPIQPPPPTGSATKSTLPIVLTVAVAAAGWMLYRSRGRN